MAKLSVNEREATDQPPPTHAPLTRRQIWAGLVLPGVVFAALLGVLLWGTLSSIHPAGAGLTAPPPTTPATAVGSAKAPAGPALAALAPPTPAAPTLATTATVAPTTVTLPPTATTALAAPTLAPTIAAPTVRPSPSPSPIPSPPSSDAARPLLGRRIGLDPGHGPRGDLGAVLVDPVSGRLILAESDLNLAVGLRTAALLRARGAQVVLTRETADSFSAPWPPDTNGDGIKGGEADDLQERIDILNAFHAEVFLSIHANSSADPAKRQGIQALDCISADCLFPAQEKRLGTLVLDQLEVKLAAAGDPVQRRELRDDMWPDYPGGPVAHLFLLGPVALPRRPRAANMPGVVVESLYVTSPAEAAQLKQDSVRQAIALAYADALQQYLTGAGP